MDEEVRAQRDKVREAERRKEQLEKLAIKRKDHTEKLLKELEELKRQYADVQRKTGYDPAKDPRPAPAQHTTTAHKSPIDYDNVRTKKLANKEKGEAEEALEVNILDVKRSSPTVV